MSHIIFHIDVNSAYLSWTAVEQLKNGADVDIRTIPAIIGGDRESRHGIVLAKSPSAKKFGIRTGEPVVNAFRKCPNLHMDPPNHRIPENLYTGNRAGQCGRVLYGFYRNRTAFFFASGGCV